MRKPTCSDQPSPASQAYTPSFIDAPFITSHIAYADAANEIATEAMVTVCAKARPSFHPRNPARIAPTSGANAAMHESVIKLIFIVIPAQAGTRYPFNDP